MTDSEKIAFSEKFSWDYLSGKILDGVISYVGTGLFTAVLQGVGIIKDSNKELANYIEFLIEQLKEFIRKEIRQALSEQHIKESTINIKSISNDLSQYFSMSIESRNKSEYLINNADIASSKLIETFEYYGENTIQLYCLAASLRTTVLSYNLTKDNSKTFKTYVKTEIERFAANIAEWDGNIINYLNPTDRVSEVYEIETIYDNDLAGNTITHAIFGFELDGIIQYQYTSEGNENAYQQVKKYREIVMNDINAAREKYIKTISVPSDDVYAKLVKISQDIK